MSRTLLTVFTFCSTALPAASSANAHQMDLFAQVHGSEIHGEAHFHGGVAAKNVTVTALDPAGEKIGETKTDEQGKFTLQAKFRCDHRLLVKTADGHGTQCTIAAGQLPSSLPSRAGAADHAADHQHASHEHDQSESIRADLAALRKQLHGYEQKTRLRDVLGGIGYILGIAGIAFYLLGVRRREAG